MPTNIPDLPGPSRHEHNWWEKFADGQVWVFIEGEDFEHGGAARFRNQAHSWLRYYSKEIGTPMRFDTRRWTEDGVERVALKAVPRS